MSGTGEAIEAQLRPAIALPWRATLGNRIKQCHCLPGEGLIRGSSAQIPALIRPVAIVAQSPSMRSSKSVSTRFEKLLDAQMRLNQR